MPVHLLVSRYIDKTPRTSVEWQQNIALAQEVLACSWARLLHSVNIGDNRAKANVLAIDKDDLALLDSLEAYDSWPMRGPTTPYLP